MTPQDILDQTAAAYGLTAGQVIACGRAPVAVQARIETARRLHGELGMSSSEMVPILKRSEWICRYYHHNRMRERRKKKKLRDYHRMRKRFPPREWCKTFSVWHRTA